MTQSKSTPAVDRFTAVTSPTPADPPGIRTVTTTNREAIRQWAARHLAEPATGEQSPSGLAVKCINDLSAGIRFNFPGFAPFRPISWDEWLAHFERHDLVLVYEEEDPQQVAERARERWMARGHGDGHDQADWFEAERDLQRRRPGGGVPDARYRLVKRAASE